MTFTAIATGEWQGRGALTHSLYALGEDGNVYKLVSGDRFEKLGLEGAPVSFPKSRKAAPVEVAPDDDDVPF